MSRMPTCPNGHEVDADVAFCRQCGASLAPRETTYLAPTEPQARAASAAQSNTAIYVLAAIIVLIGLVGIGLALVLGSGNDSGRPTPIAQTVPSTPPSTSVVPAGGIKCSGTINGGGEFGTIGSETSCGFAQAVARSYLDTAGLNQPEGQSTTVTATSPATHRTYSNIVCTVGKPWVTCVGGNNNTARMFFAHPG